MADRLEATPELPTWTPGAAAVPHPQLGRRSIYQVRRRPTPFLAELPLPVVHGNVVPADNHHQVAKKAVVVNVIIMMNM